MKKLILLTCFFLIKIAASGQILSLNGYDYDHIITMRKAFNNSNANPPAPVSIWFSSTVIKQILTVLNHETAPNGMPPDGLRIYFGYANNVITPILVSTYAFGNDPSVPSKTYHQDYYEHTNGNVLLGTAGINGIVSSRINSGPGALLYQHCESPCPDDIKCNSQDRHYIKRSFGEAMVANFGNTIIKTKCEWFDLDMFRAIDRENTYNGVRIYLGKHDANFPAVEARNTEAFIVVTTKGSTPESQTDNFNCDAAKSLFKKFISIKKKKIDFTKRKKSLFKRYTPFFEGQDNGEICPTHCPGTTLQ
jgi:hypothetical protein